MVQISASSHLPVMSYEVERNLIKTPDYNSPNFSAANRFRQNNITVSSERACQEHVHSTRDFGLGNAVRTCTCTIYIIPHVQLVPS